MAAVWKVAVVFVIENNLYGEYTPLRETTPLDDLAERAKAYGDARRDRRRPGRRRRPRGGRRRRSRARAPARARSLLEMKTYRYRGHSRTDPAKYRPEGELERWQERDPITSSARSSPPRARSSEDDAGSAPRRDPAARRRDRRPREAGAAADHRGDSQLCLRRLSPCADRCRRRGRDDLPRGGQRRARGRDGGGSDGLPARRGRRERGRRLQDERRAAGEVPGPRREHADLREHVHRRRARHVGDGPAARRRDHVQRLPADGRRRDRQRAAEVPLHVGRPVHRCPSRCARSAAATGRFGTQHSATGESWFMALPRPDGRDGRHAGRRLRRAARGDPRTTTRCSSSSTRACTGARARSAAATAQIAEIGKARDRARGRRRHDRRDAADGRPRARRPPTQLAAEGIDAEVIDLRWLRPLDLPTRPRERREDGPAA